MPPEPGFQNRASQSHKIVANKLKSAVAVVTTERNIKRA
jgi:hypothetical protein